MLVKRVGICKAHSMDLITQIENAARQNPGAYADRSILAPEALLSTAQSVVKILQKLADNPVFQQKALAGLPPAAQHNQRVRSIFSCCDYHVTPEGPKLLEINTCAGGAIAGALWQEVLRKRTNSPLPPLKLRGGQRGSYDGFAVLKQLWNSLESDWERFSGNEKRKLQTIAILDDAPKQQPFYVEFEIAQQMLEQRGYRAVIIDAADMNGINDADFVYNRCVDFYFEEKRHQHLLKALLVNDSCFSPNPRAHAVTARKDSLVYLSQIGRGEWPELALSAEERQLLQQVVPETRFMKEVPNEELWKERKLWVFKPRDRYQAKGVYRGDKISYTYFAQLVPEDYVIQRLHPPSQTEDGLKIEFRFFHYGDQIQFGLARLYTGQVINFRDPQGGAAPLVLHKIE